MICSFTNHKLTADMTPRARLRTPTFNDMYSNRSGGSWVGVPDFHAGGK